jgi:hypothetical protein
MTKRRCWVLWMILALVAGMGGSCAPSYVTEQESYEPAQPEVVAPIDQGPVKLRVAIPRIDLPDRDLAALGISSIDQSLIESLHSAAEQLSEKWGRQVEISTEPYDEGMYTAGPICLAPIPMDFGGYDVILLDSNLAQQTLRDQAFAAVPEELFQEHLSTVSPEVRDAFRNPAGELVGVIQATNPVMIIYNPERMGTDTLQGTVTLGDLVRLTRDHTIVLPPYPAIAMLFLQSAIPTLTFEQMLDPALYDRIPGGFLEIVGELLAENYVYAASRAEIARWFYEGQIDWTIDDGTFLSALKQLNYEGPVAVAKLPKGDAQSAGAMGVSWVVPADSTEQEMAWALISQVVTEPGVSRWALSNGMVPASRLGFEQGVTHGFAEQLLPRDLVVRDDGLGALNDVARSSKIWLVPAGLSPEQYQALYMTANELFIELVTHQQGLYDTIEKWREFLYTLQP